jgi:hypothetical protein
LVATYLSPEVRETTKMSVSEAVVALMGDFYLFAIDQGLSATTLNAAVMTHLQDELDYRSTLP